MSLLLDAFEDCVYLLKYKMLPDGYGGYKTEWRDGATFKAAIPFDNSLNARIARKDGVSSVYTVTTSRSVTLEFHDVFRRVRDGKIFRVTSDGDDKFTPQGAGLDMRQVSAEEWQLV